YALGRARSSSDALTSLGPAYRALELGLAHLGAARDAEAARLLLELAPRRGVSAPHRGRFLAKRGPGAAGQVLEGLLAFCAGLRLLHVALCGRALLRCGHAMGLPTATRQERLRSPREPRTRSQVSYALGRARSSSDGLTSPRLRPAHRALELGLAHLRAPGDP